MSIEQPQSYPQRRERGLYIRKRIEPTYIHTTGGRGVHPSDSPWVMDPAQNTNRVKKKLREQLKMANKILTLAELARKTETEREKASFPRRTLCETLSVLGWQCEGWIDTVD